MTPSGCLHSHSPGPSPHACVLAGAYSLVTSLPLFSLLAILPTADRGIWLNPESDYVHPLLRNIWWLLISFCEKSRIQFKFWPLWPYTNGSHCSRNLHTHTHFLGSHHNSLTLLQLRGPPPSCHHKTEVVLLLFQCEYHLFLLLVWLKLPLQCWVEVQVDILLLLLMFWEKYPIFQH